MAAQRRSAGPCLPGRIRHDPIDFADDLLFKGCADEVRYRKILIAFQPPHVVMSIEMNKDAIARGGVTPDAQGRVVILHQPNCAFRTQNRG